MAVTDRVRNLDRFYALLADLEIHCGGKRRLAECTGRDGWPARGVYFFFEPGEVRESDGASRVVRVGTHALRPSGSTLWQRLSQHKGFAAGASPGGGNHRGSIFRLHVGMAMLARDNTWPDAVRKTWGNGSSAPAEVRHAEYELERAVSNYIGQMPFLWLLVDDDPGPASDRGVIESGAIALLSNLDRAAIDPPSPTWLGRHSNRPQIRGSGLWNVNHVADTAKPPFLEMLATYLEARVHPDSRH